MRGALQIKGTDVELTEAIKEAVRERAEKLSAEGIGRADIHRPAPRSPLDVGRV